MAVDPMAVWAGDVPRLCAVPVYGAAPIGLGAEHRALVAALRRASEASGPEDRTVNLLGRALDGRSHLLSEVALGAGSLPFNWYWLANLHSAAICGRVLRPDLQEEVLGMERPAELSLAAIREAPLPAIVVIREGESSSAKISAHLLERPADIVVLLRRRAGLMVAGSSDVVFPARVEAAAARSVLRPHAATEAGTQLLYEQMGGNGAALRLYAGAGPSTSALRDEALSLTPGSDEQLTRLALAAIEAVCSPRDPLAAALATLAACGDAVVPIGFATRLLARQGIDLGRDLLPRLVNAIAVRGLGTLMQTGSFRLEPYVRDAIVSSPELEPSIAAARKALVESVPRTRAEAHSMNVDEALARWSAYTEMLDEDPDQFRAPGALELAEVLATRRDLNRARALYEQIMLGALRAELIQDPDLGRALVAIMGFASAAFESDEVDLAFERLLLVRSIFSKLLEIVGEAPPEGGLPEELVPAAKKVRERTIFALLHGLLWVNVYLARGLRLAGRYADAEAAIGRPMLSGFEGERGLEEEIALEKAHLAFEREDVSAALAHLRNLKPDERSPDRLEGRVDLEVRSLRALALALDGDGAGIAALEAEAEALTGVAATIAETCLSVALVDAGRYEQAASVITDAERKARDLFGWGSRRHLAVRRSRLALQLATDRSAAIVTAGQCILEAMTFLHDAHPTLVDLRRALWDLVGEGEPGSSGEGAVREARPQS